MTEDKIKNLLKNADRMAGLPAPVSKHLPAIVRRRAYRRHMLISMSAPLAAAAVILIALLPSSIERACHFAAYPLNALRINDYQPRPPSPQESLPGWNAQRYRAGSFRVAEVTPSAYALTRFPTPSTS